MGEQPRNIWPVSLVIETNRGGVPITIGACGVLVLRDKATEHESTCLTCAAVATAARIGEVDNDG